MTEFTREEALEEAEIAHEQFVSPYWLREYQENAMQWLGMSASVGGGGRQDRGNCLYAIANLMGVMEFFTITKLESAAQLEGARKDWKHPLAVPITRKSIKSTLTKADNVNKTLRSALIRVVGECKDVL